MMTTLAERIKEAMKGPPKVSGVELAAACGITPTSVSDWKTGKSKTIEGSNLLAASKCLNVRPEWLANGIGAKRPDVYPRANHIVNDTVVAYPTVSQQADKWIMEATAILKKLKPSHREGAVAVLRVYTQNLGPPRDGQALPMADNKKGNARVKKTS
jgi:DNA-binding Xre family transcriptional regulator